MLRFSLTSTTFPLNTACERSNSSSTLGNSAHEQALVIEGKELINKIIIKVNTKNWHYIPHIITSFPSIIIRIIRNIKFNIINDDCIII